MFKKKVYLHIILFIILTVSVKSQTYKYDFSTSTEGWTGDFADYPITDSLFYELSFYRCKLPLPLDTNKYSLHISGNNHSDDLFMFIKRKISGLLPNTTYQLMISVDLASKYPTNAVGVGGAPGEGVSLKVGASVIEPKKIVQAGFFRMNINKDQTVPGADMYTVGNVGVTDTTTVYTIINRNNSARLFIITADSNGELWVCIGTDSGYEATTTLYYNKITMTFNLNTGINNNKNIPTEYLLYQNYPNPFNPTTTIKYSIPASLNPSKGGAFVSLKIYDILGRETATLVNEEKAPGNYEAKFNGSKLTSGIYFYRMQAGNYVDTKKLIVIK
jgi:hypothetical protein